MPTPEEEYSRAIKAAEKARYRDVAAVGKAYVAALDAARRAYEEATGARPEEPPIEDADVARKAYQVALLAADLAARRLYWRKAHLAELEYQDALRRSRA